MHRACSVPQSCPTLCDPIDCCPPGFSAHGIFQARTLELVAIFDSRGMNILIQGNELMSLATPALTGRFFITMPPGKPHWSRNMSISCFKGNQPMWGALLLAKDFSFKFQLTFLVVIGSPQSSCIHYTHGIVVQISYPKMHLTHEVKWLIWRSHPWSMYFKQSYITS